MAINQGYRLERRYFQNLLSLITTLKSWKGSEENKGEIAELLDSCIESNNAILMLYRNLGDVWSALSDMFAKNAKDLAALREMVDKYHDELNEKIDEVNNYIMAIIRDLETRIEAMEREIEGLTERVDDLEDRVAGAEADIETLADTKQDKLIAGDNITIDNETNVISATGGASYTAGSGISIDSVNNTIAIDPTYSQIQSSQDFGFTSPSWMTITLNTIYSGICYNHFCAEVELLLNITTQGGLTQSATLGNISGTSLFGRILAGCSTYNKPDIYITGRCVYDRNATLKDYALRFHPIFGGDFEIQYIGETMPYSKKDFDAAFSFTFPLANGGAYNGNG